VGHREIGAGGVGGVGAAVAGVGAGADGPLLLLPPLFAAQFFTDFGLYLDNEAHATPLNQC
jgi:hypothetical protein